ncbi:hypothetical protein ACFQ2B_15450 [Streptomyces stramineus]
MCASRSRPAQKCSASPKALRTWRTSSRVRSRRCCWHNFSILVSIVIHFWAALRTSRCRSTISRRSWVRLLAVRPEASTRASRWARTWSAKESSSQQSWKPSAMRSHHSARSACRRSARLLSSSESPRVTITMRGCSPEDSSLRRGTRPSPVTAPTAAGGTLDTWGSSRPLARAAIPEVHSTTATADAADRTVPSSRPSSRKRQTRHTQVTGAQIAAGSTHSESTDVCSQATASPIPVADEAPHDTGVDAFHPAPQRDYGTMLPL